MASLQDNTPAAPLDTTNSPKSPARRNGSPSRTWLRHFLPTLLVLVIGLGVSIVSFLAVRNSERQTIRADFDRAANDRALILNRAIITDRMVLESARRFCIATPKIDEQVFRSFVGPFFSQSIDLQTLVWIPRITDASRAEFEAAMQRDGFKDFQITEKGKRGQFVRAAQRDEYFPVTYVEPHLENKAAQGVDLASSSERRKAIDRSRRLGKTVSTPPLPAILETAYRDVVLLFLPVYENGPAPESDASRDDRLRGFVMGAFRPGQVVENALKPLQSEGVDLYLFRSSTPIREQLVYFHASRTNASNRTPATAKEIEQPQGLFVTTQLMVGDDEWSLLMKPTPTFIAARMTWRPWSVLSGGISFTALLAAYVMVLANQTTKIKQVVEQRTSQLRESEERLRKMADSTHDAIIMMDPAGRISFWNAAAARMFGESADEALGKDLHSWLAPSRYQSEYTHGLEVFRQTGTGPALGKTLELQALRLNGEEFPIELSVSDMLLDGQRYAIAVLRDISERKSTEEEIRGRAEEQAWLVKSMMNAFAVLQSVFDEDGKFISFRYEYINDAFERFTGVTLEDVRGKTIHEVWPETEASWTETFGAVAVTGVPRTFEMFHGPTAKFYYCHVYRPWETTARFCVVFDDITDRKRSEETRRKNEAMLSSILNSVPHFIFWKDRDSVYLGCNQLFANSAGVSPEGIVGKNDLELPWAREEGEAYRADDREVMTSGQPKTHIIEQQHQPDGTCFWVDTTKIPLFDSDGNVYGVLGVYENITARKQAEEELHRYATALESTNKQLAEAKQSAEIATRAKSEFLANMSHEIRTPMTAILGFTEVLVENASDPASTEAADIIKRNGNYLLNLINNILDLSKIEAGKLLIEKVAFSPLDIVAEVASLMGIRAETRHLTLGTEFDGPIPQTIQTDPTRLRQILINLVGNAIKFTEIGGVRIITRLKREDGQPPALQFDVIDTGIGMTQEQVGRLFQPFTQADTSTSRRFGGTGLGLSITKRLVNLLGGSVHIQSVPRKGTTFSFTIDPGPLDETHMLSEPAKVSSKPSQENREQCITKLSHRVLLVEDGPDNQRLIAFILTKAGAKVTLAENGQEAIEQITAASPSFDENDVKEPLHSGLFDVVLMDMQMPVMDGYEATRRLRTLGYATPIIALTAHAMQQDRQQCLDAGCNDYLAKPLDHRALLEMIARYPAHSAATDHGQPSTANESCNSSG